VTLEPNLYDADGQLCADKNLFTGAMTAYIYDASGNRVAKGTLSTFSCNMSTNGFTTTNSYVIGPNGEQLSETDGSGNWLHTNVYAAGQLIATYDQGGVHFQFSDWLGTRRVETDYAGNPEETCTNQPFGDNAPPCSSPTEHFFTAKERDTESGLDYFGARYYSSATGRFLTPDWSAQAEPVPYSKLDGPQTLNLYGYAGNNPLDTLDPTGHDPVRDFLRNKDWMQEAQDSAAAWQETLKNDAQNAQQNNATTLPTGTQLTMVQTLMGEQTGEASVGTNQYGDEQSGRNAGPPTGAQITDATLDKEASLMAGTMLNLGHIGNAKTYRGLPAGKHLTALAAEAKPGSALATQLQRDIGAVRNATPSPYSQWRAVNQGFIRSRGDALRVAGTDFLP